MFGDTRAVRERKRYLKYAYVYLGTCLAVTGLAVVLGQLMCGPLEVECTAMLELSLLGSLTMEVNVLVGLPFLIAKKTMKAAIVPVLLCTLGLIGGLMTGVRTHNLIVGLGCALVISLLGGLAVLHLSIRRLEKKSSIYD